MIVLRRFPLFAALALSWPHAHAQERRIEQARQFEVDGRNLAPPSAPSAGAIEMSSGEDFDSFGIQQLLRDAEKLQPFRAFADISAFVTNNVALAPDNRLKDSFLIATFGFEYRRPLPGGWQIEASARVATFRYDKFYQLDFTSADTGVGVAYHTERFGGLDFFGRYNFNELFSVETKEGFFKNHTLTLGAQKTFSFSQAHYAYAGVSGQISFSDPKEAERSEVAGFAGYHLQATRHLDLDVFYRYGWYRYSKGDRDDRNQTLSVGVRYRLTQWCSVSASGYAVWNRSNREVFNYDAANAGGGLTFSLEF